MNQRSFCIAALALWGLACSAPDARRHVRDALHREVEPMPVVEVGSADGRVVLLTEARGEPWIEPVGSGGTLYSLEVPIAGDSTIHCLVMPGEQQLAKLVANVLEEEPPPPVSERHLVSTQVGLMDGRPFLMVETAGLLSHTEREALFELKVAGVSVGLSTLLCVLDDVGYRDTFRRVVGMIAGSLRVQDGGISREPDVHLVYRLGAGGRDTGFIEHRFHRGDDGSWTALSRTHRLEPHAPKLVAGVDAVAVQRTDAAGRILAAIGALAGPDGSAYELELGAAGGGNYRVEGTAGGERVNATFTAPLLADERWLAGELAAGDQQATVVWETWMPEVNASAATRITLACQPRERQVRRCALTGGTAAEIDVDAEGWMTRRLSGDVVATRILPPP